MATLFVEQLTVIDCSLLDAQDGLVGASFIVDIELDGALDEQGMVLDFSAVKKQIKRRIDELVDHRLLLPLRHDQLLMSETADQMRIRFTDIVGQLWEHESPMCAVCGINEKRIDCETLANWLAPRIQSVLPKGTQLKLHLREEVIDGASYRYSHGLQKHEGACQRIAHGHRSRLQMFDDKSRRVDWEDEWATRFQDIYLITAAHIKAEFDCNGTRYIELAYESQEGHYRLVLPQSRTYVMGTETTVEYIAAHIAEKAAAAHGGKVRVRAFEGVQKGAMASR